MKRMPINGSFRIFEALRSGLQIPLLHRLRRPLTKQEASSLLRAHEEGQGFAGALSEK